jgi:hypothetical protein
METRMAFPKALSQADLKWASARWNGIRVVNMSMMLQNPIKIYALRLLP